MFGALAFAQGYFADSGGIASSLTPAKPTGLPGTVIPASPVLT